MTTSATETDQSLTSAAADSGRDGQEEERVYCRSVEDVYATSSRFWLGELFQGFLDERCVTPTEVLHTPKLQRELSNFNLKPSLLQRVAQVQSKQTGMSASARFQELVLLEDQITKTTATRLRSGALPDLTAANFATAVKGLFGANPGFEGRFAIDSALSQSLRNYNGYQAKAGFLLSLATELLPAEGLEVIDQLLGEILCSPKAGEELFGWIGSYKAMLDLLIDLWTREPVSLPKAPEVIVRLGKFLADWELPLTRRGLEATLHRVLARDIRLAVISDGDLLATKGLIDELVAIGILATRLKRPTGGLIGGKRTAKLLDRRVSHLISEEKLEDILRGKSFLQKLIDLFDLDRAVIGEYSQRIVTDYLKRLFENKEFAGRLLDCSKGVRAKLRSLGDIQMRLSKCSLPAAQKQPYFRMLDEIQFTYLRTSGLFTKIGKEKSPTPEDVIEIAGLCAEGAFTEEKCMTWARDLLRQHVRNPTFIRTYLSGLRNVEERSLKLAAFNERMVAAGVNSRDLTKLRILLADDEESARGYIEMILRDLSISQIATASDGQDALTQFSAQPENFDLIICDWKMPNLSGLSFLKEVRGIRPDMPFLMVTALATLIAVEEAMAHDVTAYIAKPFPPEQLEEKVLVLINR